MAAQPQAPTKSTPLKAGIFGGVETFQDVIDKNPDFPTWSPQEKDELASQFFDEKYADLPAQDQLEARAAFNQKYEVGKLPAPAGPIEAINQGMTALNLGLGTVADPGIRGLTMGMVPWNSATQAAESYPGIQTAPGLMGQLYRIHENPTAQIPGQILGAMGGVGSIAKALPQTLSGLARNVASVGGYSGLTNAVSALRGQQTPIEALGNTAIDTALAPLAGAGRLVNAGIQGAGGAAGGFASSLLSDMANKRALDFERAKQAAMQQGATGVGMGLALGGGSRAPKVETPSGPKVSRAPFEGATQFRPGNEGDYAARNFRTVVEQQRQAIARQQAITDKQTLQAKRKALESLYNKIANLPSDAPSQVLQQAERYKADLKAQHAQIVEQLKPIKVTKTAQGKTKIETGVTATAKPVAKPKAISPEKLRAEVKAAQKAGESVVVRYYAEKHGETGQYRDKIVHDPKLDITADGNVVVRGINEDGQFRTYLERDASGSQIANVKRTGKASTYREQLDEATGKKVVAHVETGQIKEQTAKAGVKSSVLRGKLAEMEAVVKAAKSGKSPTVDEIMAASDYVKDSSKRRLFNKLPPEEQQRPHRDITGENCK